MTTSTLFHGDCLDVMAAMTADSMDSIVTDPPYGLTFMSKAWDAHGVPGPPFWSAALRVAKPGAHLLAFGGTRTHHRLMCAIEDAGWEIRDVVIWVYGSGFPKSHNLHGEWEGFGTALKPAFEPVILARKPLTTTVAANVLKYGTGALNIDGCRVGDEIVVGHGNGGHIQATMKGQAQTDYYTSQGRWPANLIHDGSDEVLELFPQSAGGSAARFFYCSKANKRDREEGLEEIPLTQYSHDGRVTPIENAYQRNNSVAHNSVAHNSVAHNSHPTVKPTDLMRYLCRLITPPGGVVLDPFMGSGSTGKAAILEGFNFVGIEMEADYLEIARLRIEWAKGQMALLQKELTHGQD